MMDFEYHELGLPPVSIAVSALFDKKAPISSLYSLQELKPPSKPPVSSKPIKKPSRPTPVVTPSNHISLELLLLLPPKPTSRPAACQTDVVKKKIQRHKAACQTDLSKKSPKKLSPPKTVLPARPILTSHLLSPDQQSKEVQCVQRKPSPPITTSTDVPKPKFTTCSRAVNTSGTPPKTLPKTLPKTPPLDKEISVCPVVTPPKANSPKSLVEEVSESSEKSFVSTSSKEIVDKFAHLLFANQKKKSNQFFNQKTNQSASNHIKTSDS
ncbi:hypothetical protein GEMRC1_013423 [Eukaryota sp. GEM-RC1]